MGTVSGACSAGIPGDVSNLLPLQSSESLDFAVARERVRQYARPRMFSVRHHALPCAANYYTGDEASHASLNVEPSLSCPKSGASIALTESLAAPLVAATRTQYEQRLSAQANAFAAEKQAVSAQQEANERKAAELEATARKQQQEMARAVQDGVQKQLVTERKAITEQESVRARQRVEDELRTQREAAESQSERIQALTQKLTAAQASEADLLKKEQLLEDKERELTLDVQKGITAGLAEARAKALAEAQAGLDLKVQDRDNTITQLRDQITSLQRKAEQSSQQAQGESLEIALEHQLRSQFPFDVIEPVAKGEFGGDVLQHVRDHTGQICGKILWESKRTKAWSDSWLTKLKGDQRAAHAELAIIVSQTMPKDVTHFEQMDGIWGFFRTFGEARSCGGDYDIRACFRRSGVLAA